MYKDPEKERAYQAQWRAEHPGYQARWQAENREKMCAYSAKWYAAHAETARAAATKRRAEHPEKSRAAVAKWKIEHREEIRSIVTNREHRKRANGGNFSRAAWEHLKALFGHCCAYCGRRMKKLTHDHVIPVSKGGWHFSGNIVPARQSCNSRKGANAVDNLAHTTVELRRQEGQAESPVLLR